MINNFYSGGINNLIFGLNIEVDLSVFISLIILGYMSFCWWNKFENYIRKKRNSNFIILSYGVILLLVKICIKFFNYIHLIYNFFLRMIIVLNLNK